MQQKKIGWCLWRRYPREVRVPAGFVKRYTWNFFVFSKRACHGNKFFFLNSPRQKSSKSAEKREKSKKKKFYLFPHSVSLKLSFFFFFTVYGYMVFLGNPLNFFFGPHQKKVFWGDPTLKSFFGDLPKKRFFLESPNFFGGWSPLIFFGGEGTSKKMGGTP